MNDQGSAPQKTSDKCLRRPCLLIVKNAFRTGIACLAFLFFQTASALIWAAPPPRVEANKSVTLGVLAFRPKPIVEAQWAPLVRYLDETVPGVTVKLRALTYPELEEAVRRREIDLVLTQPAHYVLMTYRSGLHSPLATLVNLEQGKPVAVFGSAILARADRKELCSLADLGGCRIATASTESLGGYLMPAYEMLQAGVGQPRGAKVMQTGMPHDKAVEAVLAGQADVAFVRSGVLESMIKEGKIRDGQLKVINRQDASAFPFAISTRLYAEWPIAAMPTLDEPTGIRIAAALFSLPHDGEVARAIGIHGFTLPADYHPVDELLKALRMPPFEKSPAFTIRDIANKYKHPLVIVGLLVAIILVLTALLVWVTFRLRRTLKAVTMLMHQDPLTRALNRRGLAYRASGIRAFSARHGGKFAVAMFDIDFFKKVNDERGHDVGDLVLSAIGRAFLAQIREYDALCRWGGEEFVVVFSVDSGGSAVVVADRLRAGVAEAQTLESRIPVTLSGGVVLWKADESITEAISRADGLLYVAKHEGRNCLRSDCDEASVLPIEKG